MCHTLKLAAIVVALLTTGFIRPSPAETPRAYLIEAKLVVPRADGGELTVLHPRLVTLEGQEATIEIGPALSPPAGVAV